MIRAKGRSLNRPTASITPNGAHPINYNLTGGDFDGSNVNLEATLTNTIGYQWGDLASVGWGAGVPPGSQAIRTTLKSSQSSTILASIGSWSM